MLEKEDATGDCVRKRTNDPRGVRGSPKGSTHQGRTHGSLLHQEWIG